ncbi:MAG TPA: hypothetical protein VK527_08810, partial [Candidatus Limnocylindrales bacterium]|nr:hypothetical protein [Candidatus Limnocylindrales bacterium]
MRLTIRNVLRALAVGAVGAILISGLLAFAAHAAAAPPKSGPPSSTATVAGRDVAVTVYKENLGVVKDRRKFALPSGISDLRFTEVAANIDPTSVHLRPIGKGDIELLSQDYRYDLANTDKLLEKYVDQQIEIATKDDQVKRGTLLSYDGASLVLQESGGGVL